MSIRFKEARQLVRSAYVEADFSDLATGVFVPIIEVPNGAVVIGGSLRVITAGDGGTSETMSLGTSGAATALVNAANAKVAARTAITVPNAPVTGGATYGLTRTEGGTAATVGTYGVEISYLISGSSDFTQG